MLADGKDVSLDRLFLTRSTDAIPGVVFAVRGHSRLLAKGHKQDKREQDADRSWGHKNCY